MKKTRIKPLSDKRKRELEEEKLCYIVLFERTGNRCEECGGKGDFRGLRKHEIVLRSKGGDPTDPSNCLLLCGKCHSAKHGIKEV